MDFTAEKKETENNNANDPKNAHQTAADGTEQHVTLKLMVMKGKKKVVIAEAGKEFVDILFSFLTLPLGTIARLVREESKVEPPELALLSSLYQSVENLDDGYLCTDTCREMLLRPRNSMEAYCRRLKLNIDDTEPTEYFVCDNLIYCSRTSPVMLSSFKNKKCRCGCMLAKPISVETSCVIDGFVKSNSRFMITDDLKVIPNSMDEIVNVLKNSGIKSMSSVNVMSVNITKNQVVDMLKCCLCSRTVLTDLFLEKLPIERLDKRKRIAPFDFKANDDSGKIIVKIMQRKSNGKIVFAEGKEDFANFLFILLTIPLGGAVNLMEGCSCVGSLDGLYNSVIDLDEDHFTTKDVKDECVDPVLAPQFKLDSLLPLTCDYLPKYFCYVNHDNQKRHGHVSGIIDYYLTSVRKSCDPYLERCVPVEFVEPISYTNNNDKGYLKGPTTYMVTDDLVVTPSSSISVMSLISSMSIPVDDLQEKVVSIGTEEGVRILQASLSSKDTVTINNENKWKNTIQF